MKYVNPSENADETNAQIETVAQQSTRMSTLYTFTLYIIQTIVSPPPAELSIAGTSTEFVNRILEKVKAGIPSGGLEEIWEQVPPAAASATGGERTRRRRMLAMTAAKATGEPRATRMQQRAQASAVEDDVVVKLEPDADDDDNDETAAAVAVQADEKHVQQFVSLFPTDDDIELEVANEVIVPFEEFLKEEDE